MLAEMTMHQSSIQINNKVKNKIKKELHPSGVVSGHGRLLTLGMSFKKSFYLSATKVHLTFQKEQHYGIRRQTDCYVASSLADFMVMNMELIN